MKSKVFPNSRNDAGVARALLAGYVSSRAIASHLRLHRRAVQRALVRAEEAGLVENDTHSTGKGRITLWIPSVERLLNACALGCVGEMLRPRKARK